MLSQVVGIQLGKVACKKTEMEPEWIRHRMKKDPKLNSCRPRSMACNPEILTHKWKAKILWIGEEKSNID